MPTFVTNLGLAILAGRMAGSGGEPVYIGWGTGSGQTASSTGLAAEASESRVLGSSSVVTTDTTDDTYQVQGTMVADADKSVTEVGLFTSGGTLFWYSDDYTKAVKAGDSVPFTLQTDFD